MQANRCVAVFGSDAVKPKFAQTITKGKYTKQIKVAGHATLQCMVMHSNFFCGVKY